MHSSNFTVAGTAVHVDGPVPEQARGTVVLLHGWPDTAALWDGTVAALVDRYRCVRFTWPGFAMDDTARAPTLDEMTALLHQVVLQAGGGQPVTLVLHDWGCLYGYHFARLHPALVARVVGVDIGDAGSAAHQASLGLKAKLGVVVYQLWLALAWKMGGGVGDRMARKMAALMRVPVPPARIHARMGYPYWQAWTGGLRAVKPFKPAVPMLYVYGRRKPFLFHSPAWAQALAASPGSQVVEMKTGHWVMVDAAAEFERTVSGWLG